MWSTLANPGSYRALYWNRLSYIYFSINYFKVSFSSFSFSIDSWNILHPNCTPAIVCLPFADQIWFPRLILFDYHYYDVLTSCSLATLIKSTYSLPLLHPKNQAFSFLTRAAWLYLRSWLSSISIIINLEWVRHSHRHDISQYQIFNWLQSRFAITIPAHQSSTNRW